MHGCEVRFKENEFGVIIVKSLVKIRGKCKLPPVFSHSSNRLPAVLSLVPQAHNNQLMAHGKRIASLGLKPHDFFVSSRVVI